MQKPKLEAPAVAGAKNGPKSKAQTEWYINPELTIDGETYKPTFGVSVNDDAPEQVHRLLERIEETGRTDVLEVTVKAIVLGSAYSEGNTVDDPELEKVLKRRTLSLTALANNSSTNLPALFNIYLEVTSPYIVDHLDNPVPIKTGYISVNERAPKSILSKLLSLSEEGGDIWVEVLSVRNAHREVEYKEMELDF